MEENQTRRIPIPKRIQAAVRMTQRTETGETTAEISRDMGISQKHLRTLETKYHQDPSMMDIERPGRPPKITPQLKRRIKREINKNPFASSLKIARDVNTGLQENKQIAPSTIRLHAIKNDLRCYRPAIKPYLTSKQKKERLSFAKQYLEKDMRFWGKVLFTDECQVLLDAIDRQVRRPKHKRYDAKFIRQKSKHGGGSLMFWGSIHYNGVGPLVCIEGNFKHDDYIELLEEYILKTKAKLRVTSFRLQDDNSSIHRAKEVNLFKSRNNITTLNWPANSPDLNPIEEIWSLWKAKVHRRECQDLDQLKRVAFEEWEKITPNDLACIS